MKDGAACCGWGRGNERPCRWKRSRRRSNSHKCLRPDKGKGLASSKLCFTINFVLRLVKASLEVCEMRAYARVLLTSSILLIPFGMWGQKAEQSEKPDLLARLSYETSVVTQRDGLRQVCLA